MPGANSGHAKRRLPVRGGAVATAAALLATLLAGTGCARVERGQAPDSPAAAIPAPPGPAASEPVLAADAAAPARPDSPSVPTAPEPPAAPEAPLSPTAATRHPPVPSVPAPARQTPGPAATKPPAPLVATPAPAPVRPAPAPPVPRAATPAAAPRPAPPPLDLAGLERRLRETKAIGVMTKLTLKNQVDDLLDKFRAYYRRQSTVGLAELRRPYDLLLLKVLSLLQDSDPPLARDIVASREAIWAILADPKKFNEANLMAGDAL